MTIQRTLLERIRKPDPAGQRQSRASTNEIFESILTNLQNVLNTNQGNCLTDERYGLPHLASLRELMPQSVSGFVAAILATIERHEPRLSNVRVRHAPGDGRGMSLRFEISGLVKDEDNRLNVRFETFADEEGRMQIRQQGGRRPPVAADPRVGRRLRLEAPSFWRVAVTPVTLTPDLSKP